MINIISASGGGPARRGPGKVFVNLVKGLNILQYPYIINGDLDASRRLWIQDSRSALYAMGRSPAYKVLGPNLYLLPRHISRSINMTGALYLQPSAWAKTIWEQAGFEGCPMAVWPVGIDTEEFHPAVATTSGRRVLVYHKMRDREELRQILTLLDELRLPYAVIHYGHYGHDEYLKALHSAAFVIWHGCHESQGIALQEALACDVPILVWDVTRLSQSVGGYVFPPDLDRMAVTAAPYFDESCGIKICDRKELREAIEWMQDREKLFSPREYVLKHLSLEKQARAFVSLWSHWGLTFEQGLLETARNQRKWRAPLSARIQIRLERVGRALLGPDT